MFADSGASAPRGLGTTTPERVGAAVVDAIAWTAPRSTWRRCSSGRSLGWRLAPTPSAPGDGAAFQYRRRQGGRSRRARHRRASGRGCDRDERQLPGASDILAVAGREYEVFRLGALQDRYDVGRLPYSLKVLLENALRLEDGDSVTAADVEAIASWDATAEPSTRSRSSPRGC